MHENPQARFTLHCLSTEVPAFRWQYDGVRNAYHGFAPSTSRPFMPTPDVTLQQITPIGSNDGGAWVISTSKKVRVFYHFAEAIDHLQRLEISLESAAVVLQKHYPRWELIWRSDRLAFELSLGASAISVSHIRVWCVLYEPERFAVTPPPLNLIRPTAPPMVEYKSNSFSEIQNWLLETVPPQ